MTTHVPSSQSLASRWLASSFSRQAEEGSSVFACVPGKRNLSRYRLAGLR